MKYFHNKKNFQKKGEARSGSVKALTRGSLKWSQSFLRQIRWPAMGEQCPPHPQVRTQLIFIAPHITQHNFNTKHKINHLKVGEGGAEKNEENFEMNL